MVDKGNLKRKEQLGLPFGTANSRLRKMIMFRLVQELGRDKCFQCGEIITDIDHFSIEHKTPWMDSNDPPGLFFDLENIAFSHLSCNIRESRGGPPKGRQKPVEHGTISEYRTFGCRCDLCRKAHVKHHRNYRRKLRQYESD
jgi:hypothetical protein